MFRLFSLSHIFIRMVNNYSYFFLLPRTILDRKTRSYFETKKYAQDMWAWASCPPLMGWPLTALHAITGLWGSPPPPSPLLHPRGPTAAPTPTRSPILRPITSLISPFRPHPLPLQRPSLPAPRPLPPCVPSPPSLAYLPLIRLPSPFPARGRLLPSFPQRYCLSSLLSTIICINLTELYLRTRRI